MFTSLVDLHCNRIIISQTMFTSSVDSLARTHIKCKRAFPPQSLNAAHTLPRRVGRRWILNLGGLLFLAHYPNFPTVFHFVWGNFGVSVFFFSTLPRFTVFIVSAEFWGILMTISRALFLCLIFQWQNHLSPMSFSSGKRRTSVMNGFACTVEIYRMICRFSAFINADSWISMHFFFRSQHEAP